MNTEHEAEGEKTGSLAAGPGCVLKRVLDLIGGKWKVLILCSIYQEQPIRYGNLRRMVTGINGAMLSSSLKELETAGMIARQIYDERPPRVEYFLTEKGESIIPILLSLQAWGDRHLKPEPTK